MDWDKLRIFHAAADAGSFTHAGDKLNMSQSAVSRQVSALERELNVPLFHRHARGLVLTEQGELLYRTADDVFHRLQNAETRLADSKTKPSGELRVTTTIGLGSGWLTPRLRDFVELYPDIQLELILQDDQLDLTMREADVGIWLKPPTQVDLIQRRLFTVHLHAYASIDYVRRFGSPADLSELDKHRLMTFGGTAPSQIKEVNWLEIAGRNGQEPRKVVLKVNSLYALKQAVRRGIGLAVLPDYMARDEDDLLPVLKNANLPAFDTFLVYPEALKASKRVAVFRDFLVSKAREWSF